MSFHLRGLCRILILVGLSPPGFTSTYIYFQVKNKKATIITNKQIHKYLLPSLPLLTFSPLVKKVFDLCRKGF